MAMEVLLRRTIEGVGDVGEVVKVKNGYARNYLFPQGYAAPVNADTLRRVEKDKKVEAVRQDRLAKERAEIAERLDDLKITVEARAGEDGHLYGSVGVRQVIASFLDEGFRFVDRQIRFETVRELGEYECVVVLSQDVQVPVKIWVVQDATEAAIAAEEAAREAEEGEAVGEAPAEDRGPRVPEGDLLDM